MNKLSMQSLIAVMLTLSAACYDDDVAELGVFPDKQGSVPSYPEPPSTLGDASVVIPFTQTPTGLECHRLVAHAADGAGEYAVPGDGTYNVRFTFRAPWQGNTFIRSVKPIVGNERALHHWLLYADPSARAEGVEPVADTTLGGQLVYGWTPGNPPLQLGIDTGIAVSSDVTYSLAVRYSNLGGAPTTDASGVEICVSPAPVIFRLSLALEPNSF